MTGMLRFEQFDQLALRAARFAARATAWMIAAVGVHIPGLHVVGQVDLQALRDDPAFEFLVEDREGEFDAAEEVPLHPIGT